MALTREVLMPHSAPVDGFSLAYDRSGTGEPVILLHGFPYDVDAYDAVSMRLAAAGRRQSCPTCVDTAPTTFLSAQTTSGCEFSCWL